MKLQLQFYPEVACLYDHGPWMVRVSLKLNLRLYFMLLMKMVAGRWRQNCWSRNLMLMWVWSLYAINLYLNSVTFRSWVIPVNYWTDGLDSNQAEMYQDITWLCDRSWNRAEQELGPRKSMLKAVWRIKCIGKYLPFMTLSVKHTWWRKRRLWPNVAIMAGKESFVDWEQKA